MNRPNTVSISNCAIWPPMRASPLVLAELVAELVGALVCRPHRTNDRLVDPIGAHRGKRALGRPALRGHALAERRGRFGRPCGELGRAAEGPDRERARGAALDPKLARRALERLDEEEHVRRAAPRDR